MTTGSVPNFIEVVLNLGANEIFGDSTVRQAYRHGHKIIFYGDDTWLKLFPNIFHRNEGTNSFYVNDFTEVDYNVTRNVAIELEQKDWSVMILHYLGLDHIGHIAGPFSPLIKPKLEEMDEIIGSIESYVSAWNRNHEPTLFLVCGDHGMKDSGGHGGATSEETLVPLLAFGRPCTNKNEDIAQIDIASTLSVLLGTPIPSSNLGSVILELMSELTWSQKLFALYYNAEQLFLQYQKIPSYSTTDAFTNYQNAIKLHSAWLNANSHPNEMVPDIILMYQSAIVEMKNTLTSSLLEYNVQAMTLATVLLGHILYIFLSVDRQFTTRRNYITVIISTYISWAFLNQILDPESQSALFLQELDSNSILLAAAAIVTLFVNCYLCATRTIPIYQFKTLTSLEILLAIGTLLHTISLCGTSFVEEEHQTWYFYWITLLTFFTHKTFREESKQSKENPSEFYTYLIIVMIVHRVLRKLNSTGDKYAHLPDLSGWLQNQESNIPMTVVLVSGLSLLILIDYLHEQPQHKKYVLVLDGFIATLTYIRHAVTDTVFKPSFYFDSRGTVEMYYFWAFMGTYLVHNTYRLAITMRHNRHKIISHSLFFILKKWVIISCVLHRPYNVILLPLQLIVGVVIHNLTKNQNNSGVKVYLYLWSSNAFYFYQGNSNSLATIDVAAGYVGLESYLPVITGIFLSINTYSAPILGLLLYLYDYSLQYPLLSSKSMLSLCTQYTFWRLVPITFYTIVTSLQRYHLFVWTVFSPKLLYEAMYCIVLFSVMFLLQFNFIFYEWRSTQTKIL
ncbi:GPI ethanolamine phosphate transferase 2 isoform X2 [Phymastichus coffea]|nr:GPI ethanolamine phosphate transferase 2 isoform X2 [Phymastichus coffea]